MLRHVIAALAPVAILAPAPLLAQDRADDAPLLPEQADSDFSDMAERMQDPERQREMALMLRTMSEVLLDLPLAPLMNSMSEIVGEEAPKADPDATLRSIAPEAGRVPEQIEKNLPRALDAMGSMAEAFETMLPELQDMAARLKDTVPQTR